MIDAYQHEAAPALVATNDRGRGCRVSRTLSVKSNQQKSIHQSENLEVPVMSDQPNNVQASTTNRISHIFTPFIYVETDDDGSNPRIVDVEWIDSYLNSTDLATQTIINEDYTDKLPSALAASEWLDQHTPRLSALIRSVKP